MTATGGGISQRPEFLPALLPLIREFIYDRKHDVRQHKFFPLALCLRQSQCVAVALTRH